MDVIKQKFREAKQITKKAKKKGQIGSEKTVSVSLQEWEMKRNEARCCRCNTKMSKTVTDVFGTVSLCG